MTRSLLALALLIPTLATAQTPGTCTLGTAQADLATADLSASVFNTGSLFYGNGAVSAYLVPRARGTSPIYAASLWAGGRVGGEVRTAGGTYGAGTNSLGFTFWPGPLDAGAALPNPADCSAFDRIWRVAPADIAAYEAGGTLAADLREWPVGLGAPAVNAQGQTVVVSSRAQRLDLPGGERPVLGGGPTAFWVMNDVGNSHGQNGSAPLGIEVQVTAFAPEVGALTFRQGTFYRYKVVNRSAAPITDFHVGMFADVELGDAADDLVGVDMTRGLSFGYDAYDLDAQFPPAFGLDVLSGLYAAPSIYKGGSFETTGEPRTATQLYNRLRGLWSDGTPVRAYADGYGQTQGAVTRVSFPGDPVAGAFWSMENPGPGLAPLRGDDRRVVFSGLPVTLTPGASTTFDVGMLYGQGVSRLASISVLRRASDQAQAAYASGDLFAGRIPGGADGLAAPTLVAPSDGASFYEAPVTFSWDAVPGASAYVLELSATASFAARDAEVVTATTATLPATRFAANQTDAQFWRVRSVRDGEPGPPAAARAIRVYRYAPAALTLASGAPAYVETTAPGGGPACDGPSDPDEGCAEVGGDLVLESLNSTGAYRLTNPLSTYDSPAAFGPKGFEIRFTARGSIGVVTPGSVASVSAAFRAPFELWDIGPTAPGAANDPSDDRQLVARFGLTNGSGSVCGFDFTGTDPNSGAPNTRFLAAYYPVDDDYAAYEALVAPAVAAAADGCAGGTALAPALARIDVPRGRPLYGFTFEQAAARSVADLAGTTVRFYTTQRAVAAEDAPGEALGLRLGAAFPNPASAALTVPVSLPAVGRLRLVDVLGRTVLEMRLDAGDQRVRLETDRIAAGVYAVVLEAGAGRAVRTVTIVR